MNLGTNGILSLSNAVYSGSGSGLTNLLHSSTVSAGANVTVTPTQNPDGSTNYAIASSGGGSVTYPFAATTATNAQQALISGVATNGATVSVDASMTVTPTVNVNGTTNYLLTSVAGGGSATNAIALTNGIGYQTTLSAAKSIAVTNQTVIGTSFLNSSNLDIFYSVGATNNYLNGLIPVMTESNLPSGLATANTFSTGNFPWHAFQTNSASVWSTLSGGNWVQYQFSSPVTILFSSVNSASTGNSLYFQYSNDGSNWTVVSTNALVQNVPVFFTATNPITASYFIIGKVIVYNPFSKPKNLDRIHQATK